VELVSGRWQVKSESLARGNTSPRRYLRIYFHGRHIADVRSVEEVAKVMAAHGLALSELFNRNDSRLR
jgi:hypothetical protein